MKHGSRNRYRAKSREIANTTESELHSERIIFFYDTTGGKL